MEAVHDSVSKAVNWFADHVGDMLFAVYAAVAIAGILLVIGAAIYTST